MIGGFNNENRRIIFAIDESLIIHNSAGEQIWCIGGIETKDKRVRLTLSKERNTIFQSEYILCTMHGKVIIS